VAQVVQTDNGSEFSSSFHYHVLDKGVGHRYIRPARPSSTARWSALAASTLKSSSECSTAS
jgi:hypothetical protein